MTIISPGIQPRHESWTEKVYSGFCELGSKILADWTNRIGPHLPDLKIRIAFNLTLTDSSLNSRS